MDIFKPYFLQLSRNEQKAALEAIIFASEEAVTLPALYKILINEYNPQIKNGKKTNGNGTNGNNGNYADVVVLPEDLQVDKKDDISLDYFTELINEINRELIETNRPFHIVNVAGGYQFATRSEYGSLVQQLIKSKSKKRLSQASLEALAIIAYKQPISKPEIEQIRGVNSNEVVNSLIEKNLVEIAGRKEGLGKPLTYGTTSEFLRVFGLNSLEELPRLRELEEFMDMEDNTGEVIEISVPKNLTHEFSSFANDSDPGPEEGDSLQEETVNEN